MPLTATDQQLLDDLDATVRAGIEALRRADGQAVVRPGEWGPPEVVAHLLYWHDATAWGIASTSVGGPPWPLPSAPDPINAASLQLHGGESVAALLDQLEGSHRRLVSAARRTPDAGLPVFVRPTGEVLTARQRIEAMTRHWRGHLEELTGVVG